MNPSFPTRRLRTTAAELLAVKATQLVVEGDRVDAVDARTDAHTDAHADAPADAYADAPVDAHAEAHTDAHTDAHAEDPVDAHVVAIADALSHAVADVPAGMHDAPTPHLLATRRVVSAPGITGHPPLRRKSGKQTTRKAQASRAQSTSVGKPTGNKPAQANKGKPKGKPRNTNKGASKGKPNNPVTVHKPDLRPGEEYPYPGDPGYVPPGETNYLDLPGCPENPDNFISDSEDYYTDDSEQMTDYQKSVSTCPHASPHFSVECEPHTDPTETKSEGQKPGRERIQAQSQPGQESRQQGKTQPPKRKSKHKRCHRE